MISARRMLQPLAVISDARAYALCRFIRDGQSAYANALWAPRRRSREDGFFWCRAHEADALLARGLVTVARTTSSSRLLQLTADGVALTVEESSP